MIKTSFPAARFLKASPVLAIGLLFMGAAGNCGFNEPGCEEIAILCDVGEVPIDTDGDGCEDSCEPDVNCLAEPVCNTGDTQVDGPSGCLQDDAVCYDVTTCGSTIWCTGPAVTGCYIDDDCDDGQRCDLENYCDSPCGNDMDCLVACMGRCVDVVDCPAIEIMCDEGEEAVDSNGDGCIDSCAFVGYDLCWSNQDCSEGEFCDNVNYCETPCGENDANCVIACMGRCVEETACAFVIDCAPGYSAIDSDGDGCDDSCILDDCDAIPVCLQGEVQVDPQTCEIADIVCTERTACGLSIMCTPDESTQSCWSNEDCSDNATCDTQNYCELPPDCLPDGPCEAVCAGRCIEDVVCLDYDILCEEGYVPGDTNGDGCDDGCVPVDNCLAIPTCAEGETEVESSTGCLQDDAVCYEVTVCSTTIWCTGPA